MKIFQPEIYFRVNPRNSQLWSVLHHLPEYAQRIKSDEDWDDIIEDFGFDVAIWIDEGNVHREDVPHAKTYNPEIMVICYWGDKRFRHSSSTPNS